MKRKYNRKKGGALKLSGQGLSLSGGSYIMSGDGWRTGLGGALVGLGVLGAAGNIGSGKSAEGVIGGGILGGLGSYLIHQDRQRKKGSGMSGGSALFHSKVLSNIQKGLKQGTHQIGVEASKINKKHVRQFINEHKNKQIHVRDIFGADWKQKSQKLKAILKQAHSQQSGGNIFGSIGKLAKKGVSSLKRAGKTTFHELGRWADGKTSFPPSKLAMLLSGVAGVAAGVSTAFPLIGLPAAATLGGLSAGLGGVSGILNSTGRGMDSVSKPQKKIPKSHLRYVRANPAAVKVVEKALAGHQGGEGIMDTLRGLGKLAKGAIALYKWISKSGITMAQVRDAARVATLAGNGLSLAGGSRPPRITGQMDNSGPIGAPIPWGCSRLANGKLKCDKYSVWHGKYPMTRGRLRKEDLMVKPGTRKIISKKKHMMGKKMMQQGRGIYA